jgi:hypothetical protein
VKWEEGLESKNSSLFETGAVLHVFRFELSNPFTSIIFYNLIRTMVILRGVSGSCLVD